MDGWVVNNNAIGQKDLSLINWKSSVVVCCCWLVSTKVRVLVTAAAVAGVPSESIGVFNGHTTE